MKENKRLYRSFSLIGQMGISILVPIFIGIFIGYRLDRFLGTSAFFILFFFLGALAGFRNIYRMAKKIYDDTDEEKKSGDYEQLRKKAQTERADSLKKKRIKK